MSAKLRQHDLERLIGQSIEPDTERAWSDSTVSATLNLSESILELDVRQNGEAGSINPFPIHIQSTNGVFVLDDDTLSGLSQFVETTRLLNFHAD